MNTQKLEKLVSYLLSGNLKAEFDMYSFTDWGRSCMTNGATDCGTVGCAIGHAPFLGEGFEKSRDESWNDYSLRVLGIDHNSVEWKWCFGSDWTQFDNSPEGAAKRIQYLLDGKRIPEEFEYTVDEYEELWDFIPIYGGTACPANTAEY